MGNTCTCVREDEKRMELNCAPTLQPEHEDQGDAERLYNKRITQLASPGNRLDLKTSFSFKKNARNPYELEESFRASLTKDQIFVESKENQLNDLDKENSNPNKVNKRNFSIACTKELDYDFNKENEGKSQENISNTARHMKQKYSESQREASCTISTRRNTLDFSHNEEYLDKIEKSIENYRSTETFANLRLFEGEQSQSFHEGIYTDLAETSKNNSRYQQNLMRESCENKFFDHVRRSANFQSDFRSSQESSMKNSMEPFRYSHQSGLAQSRRYTQENVLAEEYFMSLITNPVILDVLDRLGPFIFDQNSPRLESFAEQGILLFILLLF